LGNGQLAFGTAETLINRTRFQCHGQCPWVGIADVFARHAQRAARHIQWVAAAGQHAAQPVQRGIRIAAANRFMQRRYLVVEILAALVEAHVSAADHRAHGVDIEPAAGGLGRAQVRSGFQ
jgi:hypothetical protein